VDRGRASELGRRVRVGIFQNKPLSFVDDQGQAQGIYPEILKRIAAQEQWSLEFVMGSWSDGLARLEKGEIDLMISIVYSKERDEIFDFSSEAIVTSWGQLYTQKDSGIVSILDVAGKTVGVMSRDINGAHFERLCREFGVDCQFVEAKTYDEVCGLIASRAIDAGVINNINGGYFQRQYAIHPSAVIFTPVTALFATPSGRNADLLAAIDTHVTRWKQDRDSFYYATLNKWYGTVETKTRVPYGLIATIVAVAAGISLLLLLWTVLLESRVRARTRQLKESERKYRRLVESLEREYFIYSHGVDGVFTYVSPSITTVLGYSQDEFLTHYSDHLTDSPINAAVVAHTDASIRGEKAPPYEVEIFHRDGSVRLLEVVETPVRDAQEAVIAIEGIAKDITKRKRAEEQRQALEGQVRHQQRLESIGTLAGGVAHEINNPINGIMNYAELIKDGTGDDGSPGEIADKIIRETKRVATIVRNLLTFARQEKQSHSPANMADIVETTLSLIQTVMRHDQITVEVDVPRDLPKLKCRSQQLQQVLMNLMANARDALNERYPEYDPNKNMCVSARLFERDGKPWIRTTVEDHGAGIAPDVVDRIFDPFFTSKGRDQGTGLGLSISHGIVQEHHGELSVECEPGQYTRFHLDLPVDNGWELGTIQDAGESAAEGNE